MAQLSRHPSLRFSVFEVAADIGIEKFGLDGTFEAVAEEEEHEPSPTNQQRQRQRQTQSSDELADSPFPLTPPSSNIPLVSPRPLAFGSKKLEEQQPRFIERFPTPSRSPELFSLSTTPKPTTPRSPYPKLRKAQTPNSAAADTPGSEMLLDFTDSERDRHARKDTKKKHAVRDELKQEREREKFAKGILLASAKKSKENVNHQRDATGTPPPSHSPLDDEDDKKLLGGLLRFRTRSKERKAAAKAVIQQKASIDSQGSGGGGGGGPPPKPHTPPPLPIASRFARANEQISFRPKPQESESSHGPTSVGHGSSTSSDLQDAYPRARDRSSRYERPHPVWRTGASDLGYISKKSFKEEETVVLPAERHAYPPGQSIFDREPARLSAKSSPIDKTQSPGGVDIEVFNKYYGIIPESSQPPSVAQSPLPPQQSQFVAAQAQPVPPESINVRPAETAKPVPPPRSQARTAPPPSKTIQSPYVSEPEMGSHLRARRGRMNIPPALDPTFVLPRRIAGAFNPPPTPPPNMELPPIPTQLPEDLPPPRGAGLRPTSTQPPSKMRTPSPNLRVEPSTPSPRSPARMEKTQERVNRANASQDLGLASPPSPHRPLSPQQRGKTPAFPARPITPTKGPAAQPSPVQSPAFGDMSQGQPNAYLINRRPEYEQAPVSRSRKSSVNEEILQLRSSRSQSSLPRHTEQYPVATSMHKQSFSGGGVPSSDGHIPLNEQPIPRKRSIRKPQFPSGYESDDAESRYSRDTYYGRETAYFDDANMPPLPTDVPPLPTRDFGDVEKERQLGRERLLRMFANGNGRAF